MNIAKINDVIKASPAIQIQSKITLLQRRAWNLLLANAYNELPHTEVHSISIGELAAKLGFKDQHSNHSYLKEALRALRSCEVEWNILGKDKEEWGVSGLLAEVRIQDGLCFYQFPHTLRLRLHNPRVYAKLNLRIQNQFSSRYALVLWEICFDYYDAERNKGETPFILLETFKSLIGVEETDYSVYKVLNQCVIKPAVKEINDLTDYHVEVEQKRHGRRVAELKFRITKVKQIPLEESLFPDIENLPPVAVELVQAQIDRKMALKIAEQEWDFVTSAKVPPPDTYPDFLAYIAEKIEISLDAASVKNRPGFIIEAIRENYQDTEIQKQREQRAQKLKEKQLEDLTAEFRVKRANIIRQAVHANPELVEKAAARIQSYMVKERLHEHDSVIEVYQKGGMVKAEIDSILAAEFLCGYTCTCR